MEKQSQIAPPQTLPADAVIQKGDELRLVYGGNPTAGETSEMLKVATDGTMQPKAAAGVKGKITAAGKTVGDIVKALEQSETVAGADSPVDVPTVLRIERVAPGAIHPLKISPAARSPSKRLPAAMASAPPGITPRPRRCR